MVDLGVVPSLVLYIAPWSTKLYCFEEGCRGYSSAFEMATGDQSSQVRIIIYNFSSIIII